MTIDEMKAELIVECNHHPGSCSDNWECPLQDAVYGTCVGMKPDCYFSDDEIEQQYELLIANRKVENDPVNRPSHYTQGGIECLQAMEAAFGKEALANFCKCNAFKYIWREKLKNGKEDVEKAIFYLNKYLELIKDE